MGKTKTRADYYNDPKHDYRDYWTGRDYELAAEELALKRLLKGKHFAQAVDVGGGYGRLTMLLVKYADRVTLVEPSQKQLDLARDFLRNHPGIDRQLMAADNLTFATGSVDLVTMIRVIHHLPDPSAEFAEIARVLAKNGLFILEVANLAHGRNRLKYFFKGRLIPTEPVDIRSAKNRHSGEPPFVNHNPKTIFKQLAHAGLKVEKVLSVSNLRSPTLKKFLPKGIMLLFERLMQPALARTYFGPSLFFLVRKAR